MARNVNMRTQIAKKLGTSPKTVRPVPAKTKVSETINAVNYIMAKLEADDSTLANSMKKTIATATTELAQIPAMFKPLFSAGKSTTFGCFFEAPIPFIINGATVISFDRSNSAEEVPFAKSFAKAIEHYVASKVGNLVADGVKSPTRQNNIRNAVTTNLAAVDAEIASMVATY